MKRILRHAAQILESKLLFQSRNSTGVADMRHESGGRDALELPGETICGGDAVAGPHRRQCHALVENERVLDIAVQAKSVRFEVGTIGTGREKVNRDVV